MTFMNFGGKENEGFTLAIGDNLFNFQSQTALLNLYLAIFIPQSQKKIKVTQIRGRDQPEPEQRNFKPLNKVWLG